MKKRQFRTYPPVDFITSIKIDGALRDRLREEAMKNETTISRVIRLTLRQAFQKQDAQAAGK